MTANEGAAHDSAAHDSAAHDSAAHDSAAHDSAVYGRVARDQADERRDLGGLASSLVVLLALYTVTALVGVAFKPVLIVVALLNLAIIVVFLTWFYRARMNAGQLDWPQRWSQGWAIGSWFVPICFLWFPYQIMADIWRASLPEQRDRRAWLLAAWWACWCLAWFVSVRRPAGSIKSTVSFDGTPASLLFSAAAAVLLARIVSRVSAGWVGQAP